MRLGADLRLVGTYGAPFSLAVGGQFFTPSGSSDQYTSDNLAHGIVRLAAAGEAGAFVWAANVGYHVRAQQTTVDGNPYGTALVYGAAPACASPTGTCSSVPRSTARPTRVAVRHAFFTTGSTPVEAILGAHYTIGEDWRVGAGAGPGITHDLGSPVFRVLALGRVGPRLSPAPGRGSAAARRGGAASSAPASSAPASSAPAAEARGPRRRRHSDAEDACPDVPGVKTDNPKTNGCPPDRDGDGIPDAEDACPDAPGPHTDDPKTNGCPKAAVVNGQIEISEQVKFATGSAKILHATATSSSNAVAKLMADHPEIKHVRVEGHTDNVGKAADEQEAQPGARRRRSWRGSSSTASPRGVSAPRASAWSGPSTTTPPRPVARTTAASSSTSSDGLARVGESRPRSARLRGRHGRARRVASQEARDSRRPGLPAHRSSR